MREDGNQISLTETEKEPKIIIRKAIEAPAEIRNGPFFDAEIFGMAHDIENIYLPDSDVAISIAIAAHEIGHLTTKNAPNEDEEVRFDNYEAVHKEEQRAWDNGWEYIKKYLPEYFTDDPETVSQIEQLFYQTRDLVMSAVEASKVMYLKKGALDGMDETAIKEKLKSQRQNFFSSPEGQKFLEIFAEIKNKKIGKKPDWEKFVKVITLAIKDILNDNKKRSSSPVRDVR